MPNENEKVDLCPGCGEPARSGRIRPGRKEAVLLDSAERLWHERCALRALAEGFRTPLSPAEATAAVEYEGRIGEPWKAEHAMRLREVALPAGVEVSGLFVGQQFHAYGVQATIRAADLPRGGGGERACLVVDTHVARALTVQVDGTPRGAVYSLLGERVPERGGRRPASRHAVAVGWLRAGEVPPGKVAQTGFSMPAPFRGERVVADDWEGWEVVRVQVGVDPGRWQREPHRLTARSTPLPTYVSLVGETVTYHVRNLADRPRDFAARVYGQFTWEG